MTRQPARCPLWTFVARNDEPGLIGEDDGLGPLASDRLVRIRLMCVFTVASLTVRVPAILVGESTGHQAQDLPLAVGQVGQRGEGVGCWRGSSNVAAMGWRVTAWT